MKDLLEALNIFNKYIPDEKYPTWCEHDVLHVCCSPDKVSVEDKLKLSSLGFIISNMSYEGEFISYKFGSC